MFFFHNSSCIFIFKSLYFPYFCCHQRIFFSFILNLAIHSLSLAKHPLTNIFFITYIQPRSFSSSLVILYFYHSSQTSFLTLADHLMFKLFCIYIHISNPFILYSCFKRNTLLIASLIPVQFCNFSL